MAYFVRGAFTLILALIAFSVCRGAHAQDLATVDRQEVRAFFDQNVAEVLQQGGIPGATLSVVHQGEIIHMRGFGLANVADGHAVAADETLFRIGSVSKTFIYIIILQLVNEGQLGLDNTIDNYIDLDVTGACATAPTVRELLTHTAGYEERLYDMIPREAENTRDFLASLVPDRQCGARVLPAYSNFGSSLLALAAENLTGMPFHELAAVRIFEPLEMTRTTFLQPVPEGLRESVSRGYRSGVEQGFEIIGPYAVGAASSTASDMARFMIALLNSDPILFGGRPNSEAFDTLQTMSPWLQGMAAGFYRQDRSGVVAVSHAGGTFDFISDMRLYPEYDLGVFVSMNSRGEALAAAYGQRDMFTAFVDQFLVVDPTLQNTIADEAAISHMAGRYLTSRRFHDGPGTLSDLLSAATVTVTPDGELIVSWILDQDGAPKVWRYVGQNRFVSGDTDADRLEYIERPGLSAVIASDDLRPFVALERVEPHRNPVLNLPLLGLGLFLLTATVIVWPVSGVVRWIRGQTAQSRNPVLRLIVRLGAIGGLVFITGWVLWIATAANGLDYFKADFAPWLHVLHLSGLLCLAGAASCLLLITREVMSNALPLWRSVGWGASMLGFLAIIWIGYTYDLFGPSLEF